MQSIRDLVTLKAALQEIEHNPLVAEMQSKYNVGKPQFKYQQLFSVGKEFLELEIDLGKLPEDFYSDGADYANLVISICKENNGITNVKQI